MSDSAGPLVDPCVEHSVKVKVKLLTAQQSGPYMTRCIRSCVILPLNVKTRHIKVGDIQPCRAFSDPHHGIQSVISSHSEISWKERCRVS